MYLSRLMIFFMFVCNLSCGYFMVAATSAMAQKLQIFFFICFYLSTAKCIETLFEMVELYDRLSIGVYWILKNPVKKGLRLIRFSKDFSSSNIVTAIFSIYFDSIRRVYSRVFSSSSLWSTKIITLKFYCLS